MAVKLLHARRARDPHQQTRFLHEARAMATLRHEGIADVYDYGDSADGAYLVMAHMHGQPLDKQLTNAGRLSPPRQCPLCPAGVGPCTPPTVPASSTAT